jgi:hypothetical protein
MNQMMVLYFSRNRTTAPSTWMMPFPAPCAVVDGEPVAFSPLFVIGHDRIVLIY